MYKGLGLTAGILLAIMIFFNGMVSNILGTSLSTLIFHIIGLLSIVIISIIRRNKLFDIKKIPIMYFLPGALSVIVVSLNNICIGELGLALTIGISMLGQLVFSALIDNFGLFGMPVIKFKKKRLISFSIILLGLFIMTTM